MFKNSIAHSKQKSFFRMASKTLEKRKVDLDSTYHVPLCYVPFFEGSISSVNKKAKGGKNINITKYKVTLKVYYNKKKKKQKMTEIILDPKMFPNKDIIKSKLSTDFGSTCQYSKTKNLVLSGPNQTKLKNYFIKNFDLTNNQIEIDNSTSLVPPNFEICLKPNLNENNLKIEFSACLNDEDYNEFYNDLVEQLDSHKLTIENEAKKKKKKKGKIILYVVYKEKSDYFNDIVDDANSLKDYLQKNLNIKDDQIKLEIIDRKSELDPSSNNIPNRKGYLQIICT